jgi:hypothetical protein
VAVLPTLDCTGDLAGADIDYVPDFSGGNADLATATRELRGVRWSDVVAVEGSRSSVIRDGRGIFTGRWDQSASGGWLMFQYEACFDDGVGLRPWGLHRDAVAEVVVNGGVRVRSLPTVDPASMRYEPLLDRGDEVFIVDGPTSADGYDWLLVQSFHDGEPGPFGWVAAAGRDGEVWIDDFELADCPVLPDDVDRLGVFREELLIHCFGGAELAFEHDANVFCLDQDALPVDPVWLASGCGYLSGDACGSCGLNLAVMPGWGTLPAEQPGRWALRGHFDDPAADGCRATAPIVGDPSPAQIIHRCRTTFVLTWLEWLGPSEG